MMSLRLKIMFISLSLARRRVDSRIISLMASASEAASSSLSSENLAMKRSICFSSAGLFSRNSSVHMSSLILAIRVRSRKESPV